MLDSSVRDSSILRQKSIYDLRGSRKIALAASLRGISDTQTGTMMIVECSGILEGGPAGLGAGRPLRGRRQRVIQCFLPAGNLKPLLQLIQLFPGLSVTHEARDHIRQLVSGLSIFFQILCIVS
jgi:hypothetical protein